MPVLKATPADISELNALINNAYRGEVSKLGWTTESHLLDGDRVDQDTLLEYLVDDSVAILKYLDDTGKIQGSVYLQNKGDKLYLGMLSVNPLVQAKGIGRKLLNEAEVYAHELNLPVITMTVISVRDELIKWYQRRGYHLTGDTLPFHIEEKFGIAKQPIQLAVLEKEI